MKFDKEPTPGSEAEKPAENSPSADEILEMDFSDLEEPAAKEPQEELTLSVDQIDKLGDTAEGLIEKIAEANALIKDTVFPEFKDTLDKLKNNDYELNGIYAGKLRTLADKCDSVIDQFMNLQGAESFFPNQIGVLTIMKRTSRYFASAEGNTTDENLDEMAKMGKKTLENIPDLEKTIQAFK